MPDAVRPIPNFEVYVFQAETRKLHVDCDHVDGWSISKVCSDEVNGQVSLPLGISGVYLFHGLECSGTLLEAHRRPGCQWWRHLLACECYRRRDRALGLVG